MKMAKNKKNKDGSINSYQITKELGHGYSVKFNTVDFQDEIEEHIFDAVLTLNNKGYNTVTSCHGHSKFAYYFKNAIRYNDGPQVTVEIPYSFKFPYSMFIETKENQTIESTQTGYYVSIRPKSWIRFFFTNKVLCSIITKYCERIPSVYSID